MPTIKESFDVYCEFHEEVLLGLHDKHLGWKATLGLVTIENTAFIEDVWTMARAVVRAQERPVPEVQGVTTSIFEACQYMVGHKSIMSEYRVLADCRRWLDPKYWKSREVLHG